MKRRKWVMQLGIKRKERYVSHPVPHTHSPSSFLHFLLGPFFASFLLHSPLALLLSFFPLSFPHSPFPFLPPNLNSSVYLKSSHNAEHLPDLCRPNALGCQRPASRKKVFLSDFKDAKHLIIISPHINFLAQTFLFLSKSYHNSLIIAVHMLS